MQEVLEVLFFGDIVGKPGRQAVYQYIDGLVKKPDLIIGNCENISHGAGLIKKHYVELLKRFDLLTSGNHIWDKKEILGFIDSAEKLLRPANYPSVLPGRGYCVIEKNGLKIGLINLMGRLFMSHVDSPWACLDKIMSELLPQTNIILLDFHAEATAEKVAMGYYAQEHGISAMVGTHTHVQTADHTILRKTTAYISDLGFSGCVESVIGMDVKACIERFIKSIPIKSDIPEDPVVQACGAHIFIDQTTGHALSIKPFKEIYDFKKSLGEMRIPENED